MILCITFSVHLSYKQGRQKIYYGLVVYVLIDPGPLLSLGVRGFYKVVGLEVRQHATILSHFPLESESSTELCATG